MTRKFLFLVMFAGTSLLSAQSVKDAPEQAPQANSAEQQEEAGRAAPLPQHWRQEDFRFTPKRYTVEVARFTSSALAEPVRGGLMNMGWRPVYVDAVDGGVRVSVGDFTSLGDARYLAEEMKLTRLAEGRVVNRPQGAEPSTVPIEGPLLNPFLVAVPGEKAKPLDWQEERREVELFAAQLPEAERADFLRAVESVSIPGDEENKSRPAMHIARQLRAARVNANATLYLAGKVARNEWPAEPQARTEAAEIVADLLYGERRDWRGAWGASRELLANPDRSNEGRARDQLRRAALMVDIAAGSEEPKPSWNEVRAALRRAWEYSPREDERLLAKIELVYLQTFAWEGRWERVEELAHDMASRYNEQQPESGLAKIFYARALERHERYDEAVRVLETVMATNYNGPALTIGNETLNLHDRARKYWRYFMELRLQEGD